MVFNKCVSWNRVNIRSHCSNTALKIYMEASVMILKNRGFHVYDVTQEVHRRCPFIVPITCTRKVSGKFNMFKESENEDPKQQTEVLKGG